VVVDADTPFHTICLANENGPASCVVAQAERKNKNILFHNGECMLMH